MKILAVGDIVGENGLDKLKQVLPKLKEEANKIQDKNSEEYIKIKDEIKPDDFLSEINKTIIKTVYSEFEEGKKEIYDYTILFEDEEIINHITSIMAEDYGITEIDKGIEDILKTYKKDKLISKRNIIMKEIEENTDKEILKKLENELNATIIELAKTK